MNAITYMRGQDVRVHLVIDGPGARALCGYGPRNRLRPVGGYDGSCTRCLAAAKAVADWYAQATAAFRSGTVPGGASGYLLPEQAEVPERPQCGDVDPHGPHDGLCDGTQKEAI